MKKYLTLFIMFMLFVVAAVIVSSSTNKLNKVAGVQTVSEEEHIVRGIILPHHKLADSIILDSYEKIKDQNYSYIVIFGPNHFAAETSPYITAESIFDYPIGNEFIESMMETQSDIVVSDELMEDEHSVTLHLPYLANYFPNAKIIPFIISPYISKEDLNSKVNYFVSNLPNDTLYISSVDFSHNTLLGEAMTKNNESISAIVTYDYETIFSFEDDHMDSPASIALLLKVMQKLGATNWEEWHNTHAALIKDDLALQGTSYVIGVFR